MRARILFATAAACLALGSLLAHLLEAELRAQNALTAPAGASIYDHRAVEWFPATSRVAWSEDGAIAAGVLAYVDDFPPVKLHWPPDGISASCAPPATPGGLTWCEASTPALVANLTTIGTHQIRLTHKDLVSGAESPASLALLVDVRASTCRYAAPGGSTLETRPLGDALQGFLPWNKTAGDSYAAARMAQLRAWGWRVEWQASAVVAASGVWVIASCAP